MRCSALTLVSKCRGSYHLTQGYGSVLSRLGTAFHEAAKAKVLNEKFDSESLRTRYALTDDEMRGIDYGIYNLQIQIPVGAMVIADNKQMIGLNGKLKGTPDLGIYHNEIVTIVDFKSGWGDQEEPETNNQLIGYGIIMVEELERQGKVVRTIHLMIVMPKLNSIKAFVFTREKLADRAKDIERIIDEAHDGKDNFTTGPWCQACFKSMNCPAFAGQVMTLAKFVQPDVLDPISVEKALKILLPIAKAVGPMSDKVEELAKAWVRANGPLELGAGITYAQVVGTKKEVKAKQAFETLKEYFDEDRIWEVVSMSMTKISDLAVATKRGLSTIVNNRLTEVGALTEETTVQYRIIKGGNKDGSRKIEGSGSTV